MAPLKTPEAGGKFSLFEPRIYYKPFDFPWCYDAWLRQQQIHWLPEEVPMADDIQAWKSRLTDAEKNLLTQVFRFFVQSDVEVNNCYVTHYLRIFKPIEVGMMLSAFSNIETVHIAAYAHLIDTLGMPETEYQAFLQYQEMRDKYDHMQEFSVKDFDPHKGEKISELMELMAMFGAFTEGLQLFASFAILLNFPRFNKMTGMGQIISWSVRDETLHTNCVISLLHEIIKRFPEHWNQELHSRILQCCNKVVKQEDAFIELAFGMGGVEGISADDVKRYIRYIANVRCRQLKIQQPYDVQENPLPWIDEMVTGLEFVNFFENRATEYSKGSTEGSWDDAFA